MKRALPVLIAFFLCVSCAGRRFAFEYEGEPFAAPRAPAFGSARVTVVPEGAGRPGVRVVTKTRVPERVAKIRVEAKAVTNWEIHGYEPDLTLLLGGALSTVAGVVVTPIWCVKGLFTAWGTPEGEEAMRQRVYDRYLRSWLFMGYFWAPVDYDVLDRRQVTYDTGRVFELDAPGEASVTAVDEQGRRVGMRAYGNGLYRPVLTDSLLESGTLYVTASCLGDSASASVDLLAWYRGEYGLTAAEVEAFRALAPARRPFLLKLPPELRADFLALDETGWRLFVERVPLETTGNRLAVAAALEACLGAGERQDPPFADDLPALLDASRRMSPDLDTWLFVVGIEDYDRTSPVRYSRRSAELFAEVAMKRLGVPAENVFLLTDDGKTQIKALKRRVYPATAAAIKDQLRFLMGDVARGDRIYVYYSGHGLPSLKDGGAPYLLARDQAPDFIHTAPFFRLDAFYGALAQSRAAEIIVFMDSCFTGGADGTSVFGTGRAATRLVPKSPYFDEDRMAVLTAGTHRQFSNMYPEKGHRLFSYFLMKELLKDHDTLESLYQQVFTQTRRVSRRRGGTQLQEPTARGNMHMILPSMVKVVEKNKPPAARG